MLFTIVSQQYIDFYFRGEVTEYTTGRIVATFVYLFLGALILTFTELRTKRKKSDK